MMSARSKRGEKWARGALMVACCGACGADADCRRVHDLQSRAERISVLHIQLFVRAYTQEGQYWIGPAESVLA
jgi:hypothetical protein